MAVFDLEGTVVDSNIVQQYLWVRTAGVRKAAWPGEVARILASLRGLLRAEARDRGEFIRTFLRRYEGMPVARLEKIVHGAYADTFYRHTSPEADRGDQGAPRRRTPHRAGHRIHPDPRRTARRPVRRRRRRAHARPRRHPDRLPGEAAARRRGARRVGAQLRRRARPRSGRSRTATATATPTWCGSSCWETPMRSTPTPNSQREAQRRHWKIDKWKRGNAFTEA